MNGAVWVPVLLVAGALIAWAAWPRRAESEARARGRGYRTLEEQRALWEHRRDPVEFEDGRRRPPGRHERD